MIVSEAAESNAVVRIADDSCPSGYFEGELALPWNAYAVVLFAHGTGSSRFSPRNRLVALILRSLGIGTLLIDLPWPRKKATPGNTHIEQMASRVLCARRFIEEDPILKSYPVGLHGSGAGAAAALIASAFDPGLFRAIVLRSARLDLAGGALSLVQPPTLLIAGSRDLDVVDAYRQSLDRLGASVKRYELVPGSGHLFEEPGALETVALKASGWFEKYLSADVTSAVQPKSYAYLETAAEA